MRTINRIVIHCSASPNGMQLGKPGRSAAQIIDGWHRTRGFHRSDSARAAYNPDMTSIGYHWVIDLTGAVLTGRYIDEIGAHASGHNADTLGVCLIGTDSYTLDQWSALRHLVEVQRRQRPNLQCIGHRDLSPDLDGDGKVEPNEWLKTCPGFDVGKWEAWGRAPMPGKILLR